MACLGVVRKLGFQKGLQQRTNTFDKGLVTDQEWQPVEDWVKNMRFIIFKTFESSNSRIVAVNIETNLR